VAIEERLQEGTQHAMNDGGGQALSRPWLGGAKVSSIIWD
jgi:hypothetical protein